MEHDLRRGGLRRAHLRSRRRSAAPGGPQEVIERPIYSVGSGPSMAPVAALTYATRGVRPRRSRRPDRLRHGRDDVRRRPRLAAARSTPRPRPGSAGAGSATSPGIRAVDVKSIGAGGGSIVWIDPGGLLRVGPQQRGRRPRPGLLRARRHASRRSPTRRSCSAGSTRPTSSAAGSRSTPTPRARRSSAESPRRSGMSVRRGGLRGADDRDREHRRRDPRDHDRAGHRPARGDAGRGRRRLGPQHRPDRSRARLPARAAARRPRARSRPAARSSRTSISEFSRSRYAETRSLDRDAVNEALADVEARADAFLGEPDRHRP